MLNDAEWGEAFYVRKSMVFDIGAHIGNWSRNNLQYDEIYAIEASPKTFEELKQNVSGLTNIIPLHYAVCDSKEAVITFYDCHESTLSSINKDWLSSETSRFYNYTFDTIEVPVISIDNLIGLYGRIDQD
jgi:FkbM family methyltransferase